MVDYDAVWPQQYESEAEHLRPVFGPALADIHHIGSTSVPGMKAKPTVDILVEAKPGIQITDFYPGMSDLGYECRGECLDAIVPGTPGRYYFSMKKDVQDIYHVHVCHMGHPQIPELLVLRDYLRAHPDAAAEYGNLKADLAQCYSLDNVEYMRGKDSFVKRLIATAEKWKRPKKPSPATE